jgi:hypothetical protein
MVKLLTNGVGIVGKLDIVGIWKRDESKGAKVEMRQLWATARDAQKSEI